MTLLTTVQNAMVLTGLPRPASVFSNSNDTVQQFVALLYKEGRELINDRDWNKLTSVTTLTCAATTIQTGYPTSDFVRMADKTDMWNVTRQFPVEGPTDSGEWRELITRTIVSLPQYWRIINGELNIYPPSSGDTITYESISNKWINQAAGGTYFSTLLGDTDTFLFSENLLELGLIWRFKQAKQLDYAEDMKTYGLAKEQEKKNDRGGTKTITTDRNKMDKRPFKTWPGTVTP